MQATRSRHKNHDNTNVSTHAHSRKQTHAEGIRGLNLEAVRHTTVQLAKPQL